MKRYSIFFTTIVLAGFFFSCTREEMNDQETIGTGQTASDATSDETTDGEGTEEFEPYIPEGEAVTLTFTLLREDEDEAAKTYFDGSTHGWSEGDQIKIIWGTGNQDCTTATVNHKTGTVDVTVRAADTYYAVYPADGGFALRSNGQIDFLIPTTVVCGSNTVGNTYYRDNFNKANMMAARAYRSNTFKFKNLTHIVKFRTSNSYYHHFRFRSNKAAVSGSSLSGTDISGTYGVSFSDDDTFSFVTKQNNIGDAGWLHDYVEIQGVRYGGVPSPNTFDYYFAVKARADFSEGYCFLARPDWGEPAGWGENPNVVAAVNRKALTSSSTTQISKLGDIGGYLHRDWFITPDGTGSGTSWADAGGIPLLLNLLGKPTADGGLNSTWRLNNARIYMREGTYNFQSNPAWETDYPDAFSTGGLTFDSDAWSGGVIKNITKIYGGYPSSYTTGTTTTGADPTNYPTVWRSNRGASDRIFHADGCIFNDWTFDGISFKGGGTGIAVSGQAFLFDNGTSGKVTFNACSFKNFYSTASSGTYYGGGAVLVDTNGDLDLAFTACTFDTNQADRGAAVVLHNTASGSDISFTNCSFTQHRANGNGGVFYLYGGAKARFEECNFSHRTDVTYDASSGGAGSIQNEASLTLANCNFVAFTANGDGGAILNHGDLIINGGSFTSCKATTNSSHPNHATFGGAIYSDGSVTVTGTTFTSNQSLAYGTKTQNEGGGAISIDEGTLTIKGCTFVNNSSPKGGAVYARNATVTIQDDDSAGTRTTFSGNEAGGRTDATTGTVYQIPMNIGGALAVVGSSVLEVSDTDFGTSSSAGNNVALSTNASTNTTKEIGGGCVFLDDRSYPYSSVGSLDPTDAANVSSLVGTSGIQTVSFTNCNFYGNGGSGTGRGGALVVCSRNAGSKTALSGCSLSNHTVEENGGAIWCAGNLDVVGGNISSNSAVLGGGLFFDTSSTAASTVYVKGTTFSENVSTNTQISSAVGGGAAIRAVGGSSKLAKLYIFNSCFDSNDANCSLDDQGGGCVNLCSYSRCCMANTTIRNTRRNSSNTGVAITPTTTITGAHPYIYVLSCTFAENDMTVRRNFNQIWFYNSISDVSHDESDTNLLSGTKYSIFGEYLYSDSERSFVDDLGADCLQSYNNGVYPLNASKSSYYVRGYSVEDLRKVTMSGLFFTDDMSILLGSDQKGNSRSGSIMGAYVLTAAPSE